MDIELGGIWNGWLGTIGMVTAIASTALAVICSAGGICGGREGLRKRKQVRGARIGRLERIRLKRMAEQSAIPRITGSNDAASANPR